MFSIAPLFSDHAVLQRDRPVYIWGTAFNESQEEVLTISLVDFREGDVGKVVSKQTVLAPSGQKHGESLRWEAYLEPQSAGGPYELIVSLEKPPEATPVQVKYISDIRFGDVYILAGQSNIEFRLSEDREYEEGALIGLDNPQIRTFRVPRVDYPGAEPENDPENNTWSLLSKDTAGRFSAVAFYFGVRLHEHSGVPIGFIDVCRGGTSASVWVDESCLSSDPDLRIYLDEYRELLANLDREKNKRDTDAYYENLAVYYAKIAPCRAGKWSCAQIEKRFGSVPWPPPAGPYSYRTPSGLFHTMLEPCIPYGISAVIFYQGEEDVARYPLYSKLLRSLIAYWRERWALPELPFFLVQIAPYNYPEIKGPGAALLKQTQSRVAAEVPGVTLVITTDCGDADDVHPKSKRKIGERLFKKACRYILGEDVIAESPVMKSCEIRRHTMDIGFETFGSALRAGADGNDETLIGFKIAAEDGVFYSADAVIEGHHVLLTARQVSMPRFVQYAFGAFVPANLYNNEGLPAVPFSTR